MKYYVIHIILLVGILSILLLWNVNNPKEQVEAIVVEGIEEEFYPPAPLPPMEELEEDSLSEYDVQAFRIPESMDIESPQVIVLKEERTFFGSLESFMTMIIGIGNFIVFYFQRKDKKEAKEKLTS